ncbi:hypothetical protein [Arthrobacter sp. MDT1-65]
MLDDQEMRIDVYLAGKNNFDGTAEGIRVLVHSGADPDDPGGEPSCKASNFARVIKSDRVPEFALMLADTVLLKAGNAAGRGRDAISKRRRRG